MQFTGLGRLLRPSLLVLLSALPMVALAQEISDQMRLPSVTVAPVTRAEMIGQVPVTGTLVPRNEVLIYPEVSGFPIDALQVDIGDSVEKGAVLAKLNNNTLTAQLAQAEAEFARARAGVGQAESQITAATANATQANSSLERIQSLRESGTTTQSALDQAVATAQSADANQASAIDGLIVAKAQLQQSQAQLDIARLNLQRATLRAPVAGLISTRNGQVGAIAASGGEPIFRLIADGIIEVEAEVIETALGQISVGDVAELAIASVGAAKGSVRRISPIVDPRNRLGKIRIEVAVDGLRAGLFASGWIITERRQTLTVPATAVLTDASGSFVLVVNDGVLERRSVGAGLLWNDLREVFEGVAESEIVVAKAGAFFGEGDRINAILPEGQN